MERFELSHRFEPAYRISSADPSTTWVHLQIAHSHRRSILIQERIGENCWRELHRDK